MIALRLPFWASGSLRGSPGNSFGSLGNRSESKQRLKVVFSYLSLTTCSGALVPTQLRLLIRSLVQGARGSVRSSQILSGKPLGELIPMA